MNIFDAVIVICILLFLIRGYKKGFLRRAIGLACLFAGALTGFIIIGLWFSLVGASALGLVYSVSFVIMLMIISLAIGDIVGLRLTTKTVGKKRLGWINRVFGGVLEVATLLLTLWIFGGWINGISTLGVGDSFSNSQTAKKINTILPSSQVLLPKMSHIFLPNELELLSSTGFDKSTISADDRHIVNMAIESVVKVRSYGCEKTHVGSGFVVEKDLVLTNAHVIAGSKKVEVTKGFQTFEAVPVWFDDKADLALVRVRNLSIPPLELASEKHRNNDSSLILGYPGGGHLTITKAIIDKNYELNTLDIYNTSLAPKEVYVFRGLVKKGNSGGPLINKEGKVTGIVYAAAVDDSSTGYAITSSSAKYTLKKVAAGSQNVTTAHCITN